MVLAGPAVSILLESLQLLYGDNSAMFRGTGREILNSDPVKKLFFHPFILSLFSVRIDCALLLLARFLLWNVANPVPVFSIRLTS